MDEKQLIGLVSTIIGIVSYALYFYGMYRGRVKPHIFSWFIWGLIMETVFILQWQHNSGPGAWVTGISSIFCIITCLIGWKDGDKNITRSDWIVLMVCQLAIPFWYVINQPIFTMVLLTAIELLAFVPTIRKSWSLPYEESVSSYTITGAKFALSLLAIDNFVAVNWLYPAALFVANAILVSVLLIRRKAIKPPHELSAA